MFGAPLAPKQASSFAGQHDAVFYAITALTVFFTTAVILLVLYFAIRFRRGNRVDRSRPHHENLPLELAWTGIPVLMGLVMFFFGTRLFITMRVPPKDAQEIFVIGKQWMWHIQHPNGVRENNTLHVPLGKPVKLTMISQDVLHAFYIPDFRAQFHVVPGRYTQLWFTATKKGTYPLYCALYCGTQHSQMIGSVVVMEPNDFAEWLANGGNKAENLTLAQRGERLYKVLGCDNDTCHVSENTTDAPSLYGLYASERQMASGERVRADDAYLRESILRPWNKITAGYDNKMPDYEAQISEEDVLALNAYIRQLGSATPGAAGGGAASTAAGEGLSGTGETRPGASDVAGSGEAAGAESQSNRQAPR